MFRRSSLQIAPTPAFSVCVDIVSLEDSRYNMIETQELTSFERRIGQKRSLMEALKPYALAARDQGR
jgi:hypothetical protein